ncbi:hypothetical protein NQ318_012182 [Aromia moschata]|uniref:Uncharacterized protein n=1 Tax=Aromia moschata TaxID=1265417 RepID=A0AAV8Z112_9CUCU|nr:hypothetical protein NQ318_012182 [Aromia moschata]
MCHKTNKLFCFICLVMGGNRSAWTQEGFIIISWNTLAGRFPLSCENIINFKLLNGSHLIRASKSVPELQNNLDAKLITLLN